MGKSEKDKKNNKSSIIRRDDHSLVKGSYLLVDRGLDLASGLSGMKKELRQLITEYCSKSMELIPILAKELGFNLPITNFEWSCLEIQERGITPNGLEYVKHGFGVYIKQGDISIDVDFGTNGEYDGFDIWQLWLFAKNNKFSTPYKNKDRLETDFKDAKLKGELRFSGRLYYLIVDR